MALGRTGGASRWRVALVTLAVLVVLDVARSLYARVGDAQPYTRWQPARAQFAPVPWPPSRGVPATAPLGERVYRARCATCHGPDANGNGPAAPSMIPRPRDLTAGAYEYKSTAAGEPPTDSDLVRVVANGLPASAMPYWRDVLSDSEIRSVVGYIRGRAAGPPPRAIVVPRPVAADSGSVARGRRLYERRGCVACHGADGRLRLTLRDAKGHPVIARDLTAPWTFRGGSRPADVWMRLTTGLAPSPMPSVATSTSVAERWDLVNYVTSLARRPPWVEGGTFDGPGFRRDLVKRGEYLVHAEMCGLCHTQIDPTGIYRDDRYLAGGMRVVAYPHGVFVTANLTSDTATGLGRWSAAEIARAIRTGRTPTRTLNPLAMPWPFLHNLTDSDALAIGSYLKTLPPIYHARPAPLTYGVIETVVGKSIRVPPVALPTRLTYADGDFARETPGPSRDVPQRALVIAQWLVLFAGGIVFLAAGPRPPPVRAALALLVVGALIWGLDVTPALSIIPPDKVAGPINAAIPKPPDGNVMARRGYYLFSVAGCRFCHQANGAGGTKLSWAPFGTLWVRNVTSDSLTGLGAWTDAEIARAIRSGVGRGGRPLHWQAMIWDHASNWDEEDVRALVAYLRTMPPVRHAIPATRDPEPDDCSTYTFWLKPVTSPGCR